MYIIILCNLCLPRNRFGVRRAALVFKFSNSTLPTPIYPWGRFPAQPWGPVFCMLLSAYDLVTSYVVRSSGRPSFWSM